MSQLLAIVISNAMVATVLALAVFIVTRFIKSAPVVHGLWLLVLLKLVTPPMFHLPESAVNGTQATLRKLLGISESEIDLDFAIFENPALAATTFGGQPGIVANAPSEWPIVTMIGDFFKNHYIAILVVLWGIGSLLIVATAILRMIRFRRVIERSPLAAPTSQAELDQLSSELGVTCRPEARLTIAHLPPMIWCWRKPPTILVPAELLSGLSRRQRQTLFAHELAHLRRGDHWIRLFELVVVALFWWHPVVWLARRELLNAQEQCCDAWVLRALPNHPDDYAQTLMRTIDFLSGCDVMLPPAATGFGYFNLLKRRFTMILSNKLSPRMSWASRAALLGFGALVLSFGQVPSLADDAKSKSEKIDLVIEALLSSDNSKENLDEKSLNLLIDALKRVKAKDQATPSKKAEFRSAIVAKAVKADGKEGGVYVLQFDPKAVSFSGEPKAKIMMDHPMKMEGREINVDGHQIKIDGHPIKLEGKVEGRAMPKTATFTSKLGDEAHVIIVDGKNAAAGENTITLKSDKNGTFKIVGSPDGEHKFMGTIVHEHQKKDPVSPHEAKGVIMLDPAKMIEGHKLNGNVELIIEGEAKFTGDKKDGVVIFNHDGVKAKTNVKTNSEQKKNVMFKVQPKFEGVKVGDQPIQFEIFLDEQNGVKTQALNAVATPRQAKKVQGVPMIVTTAKKSDWSVKQEGGKLIITSPDGRVGEVNVEEFKRNSEKGN